MISRKILLACATVAGLAACAHGAASTTSVAPAPREKAARAIGRATITTPEGSQAFDFGMIYAAGAGMRLDLHTTFGIYLATFALSERRWDLLLGAENLMVSGDSTDLRTASRYGGLLSLLTQAIAVAFPLIPPEEFSILKSAKTDTGYEARLGDAAGDGVIQWYANNPVTGATFQIGEQPIWLAKADTTQSFGGADIPTRWQFVEVLAPSHTLIEIRRIEKPDDIPPSLVRLRAPPGAERLTLQQWIERIQRQAGVGAPLPAPSDTTSPAQP